MIKQTPGKTPGKTPGIFAQATNVTIDRIMEVIESGDYNGICLACGEDAHGVEPDARRYTCEACGAKRVYGAEELLIMFAC